MIQSTERAPSPTPRDGALPLRFAMVLASLCIAWVSDAQAGLMHNAGITPDAAYREYASAFPGVGWMASYVGGVEDGFSSINLIDPHWGLTSGHGLLSNDADASSVRDSFQIGFGSDFYNDPGETRVADAVYLHPSYAGPGAANDFALVYFSTPFSSTSPVTLYTGEHHVGDAVSVVGFGQPGTPSTGLQPNDRVRRAGVNSLYTVDSPAGVVEIELAASFVPEFDPLGMIGTPGDSGGGFFKSVGGEWQLAAINSAWAGFAGYFGTSEAAYITADTLGWIEAVKASQDVPEPSAFGLVLAVLSATNILPRRRSLRR